MKAGSGLAALAALVMTAGTGLAGDNVTSEQIVKALQPKPLTRSLSVTPQNPAAADAERRFVDTLRNRRTRSLSSGEREEIATMAAVRPNIDLEITFDYNSAEISSASLGSVQALGKALSDPNLRGSTFIVAGHTDAAGGEGYNQELSERRAESVKRYLVERAGLAPSDLVTVGYGRSKPKDLRDPMDPANRRVQVINMATRSAAR
jgi:outer membrane protein OmpA-like peptidoglycan-associated protein